MGLNLMKSTNCQLQSRKICQWLPYACNTILIVTIIIVDYVLNNIPPIGKMPGFYCNDPKLWHELKNASVSLSLLYVIVFSQPLITIAFTEIIDDFSLKTIHFRIWKYYKHALLGIAVTLFLLEICKIFITEPRPIFFEICKPDANQFCDPGEWVEDYTCTSGLPEERIIKATQSFLSGHAAWSGFSSFFSTYIIATRLNVSKTGSVMKPILASAVLTVCIVVSFSRINENFHHWWDVVAGLVLGFAVFVLILLTMRTPTNTNRIIDAPISPIIDAQTRSQNGVDEIAKEVYI